jgi:ketosteroid isomerase-like protein
MDAESARTLIAAYDAAWNAQDLETIHAAHAPDIVFHNHTAAERVEGADAVRDHIGGIFARYPDLRFRGRSQYAADDLVVSEWTATTTLPDGRRIEWDGVDIFPLRDGLIARKDVYSGSASPRSLD